MNPIQADALLPLELSRDRTAAAAHVADVDQALRDGGHLRPRWLDWLANRWASAVAPLRPGAGLDPGTTALRGCPR